MVLLRRTAAFTTDCLILLFVMGVLLVLVQEGLIEWSATRDMVLLGTVVAGFAFCESRWGQTPGKKLCGVQVVGSDGRKPDPFHALLRAVLFFIPPVVSGFLLDLLNLLVYLPGQTSHFLFNAFGTTLLAIPPISIIAGRGAYGLHDWLSGCRVEPRNSSSEVVQTPSAGNGSTSSRLGSERTGVVRGPAEASSRVMAMSTLLSLGFATGATGLFGQLFARMPIAELGQREMHSMSELAPTPVWFDQHIVDSGYWVNVRDSRVILGISKPTFVDSWVPGIPESLRKGDYWVERAVGYEIALYPGADRSSILELYLTNALIKHTARQLGEHAKHGFVVECRFTTGTRVGMLQTRSVRRLAGGTAELPDGSVRNFLLEPDDAAWVAVEYDPSWRGKIRQYGLEEY
jgi:hypothetical protein